MKVLLSLDLLADPESGRRHVAREVREHYAGREEEIPGVHAKHDAVPGALEQFNALAKAHQVVIVSSAPASNPSAWAGKVDWVARHLGPEAAGRLIIASDWSHLVGDVLIAAKPRGFAGEFVSCSPGDSLAEAVTGVGPR